MINVRLTSLRPRIPKRSAAYSVTISSQPVDLRQHCSVSNGVGTATAASITNLEVRCAKAGRFAYIGSGGTLYPYLIDDLTGALSAAGAGTGSPFQTGTNPAAPGFDPSGKFVYARVQHGGGMEYATFDCYSIDPTTGAPCSDQTAGRLHELHFIQYTRDARLDRWVFGPDGVPIGSLRTVVLRIARALRGAYVLRSD